MKLRYLNVILLALWLSACSSTHSDKVSGQNHQAVDDELREAAAVNVPQTEPPSVAVLDDLLPGTGISLPGLDQDIRLESAFDISVANAPARLFFMSLVKDTNINMVVHPSVEGEISLDLKNVTVREVMDLTREVYGYEFKHNNTGYVVLPARIQSRIFPVNYLNVNRTGDSLMTVSSGITEDRDRTNNDDNLFNSNSDKQTLNSSRISTSSSADFWSELQATLATIVGDGAGRSIVVDRHAGLVIVRALPSELRDVDAYLSSAQGNMQRQVILEAKVVEVELSDSFRSGIDWAAISSNRDFAVGTSSIVGAARRLASISSGGDELENPGIDVSGVPFGNLFAVGASTSNFSALITLLNTQGDAQVLSSPRVSTVNNQKAVIKVGTDEYFVTDISSDTVVSAGGTTSNPDLTLTPFFSGIALDVTPQISAEGQVILHIHPSVSRVVDQQKTITLGGEEFDLPLAFSTVRESDSVVKARNGEVIVIGGLMQNLSNDEDAGVPGASEVPYAGNLFKQKSNLNRRTELVILLRPIVVDSEGIWSNYIQQSADRVKQLRAPPAEGE